MEKEYGLVLAGGGTKGAYEVGVWQALQELNIKIKAISGTSIGAINAALILQDDFDKMLELYRTIKIDDIIKLDKELDSNKNIFNIKNISKLAIEYIEKKGLDNTALRKTAEKYLDIEKIYSSNIEFALTTYSFKSGEAEELFLKDIPKEKFIDYLLASACFPIFKAQKIEDKEFVDGGFYDNIPANLLIKNGYKDLIVVDITGVGIKRKSLDKDVHIKMLRSDEDLGGTFEFNQETIQKNIKKGYLDTLRSFNSVQGHYYYFKASEFNEFLEDYNLKTINGLECAAKIYGIDRLRVLNYREFIDELLNKHKEIESNYAKVRKNMDIKNLIKYHREISKLIEKGFGICLLMDIITTQPSARNFKIVRKTFQEYLEAADAMLELTYRED